MAFKIIIFDWDGTLVDSIPAIVGAMQDSIQDLQIPMVSEQAIRNIIGLGIRDAIVALYPDQGRELAFCEQFRDRYRYHYLEKQETTPPFFQGAIEMLQGLKAVGAQLAVATGKSQRGLDDAMEKTRTGYLFQAIRCADDSLSKPDPRMLFEILDQTGSALADALMVGDSEHDLAMAKNAGMASVGVTYGVQSREVLLTHEPLECFDEVADLQGWLLNNI